MLKYERRNARDKMRKFVAFFCAYPVSRSHCERGSNLLETLLAIGLVALMTPFVYNRIAETSREIQDITAAKEIVLWKDRIAGYVRKNQADWPQDAEVDLDQDEMYKILGEEGKGNLIPYAAFLDKYKHKAGTTIDSYLIFRGGTMSEIRIAKIAKNLGTDAAIVNEFGVAYSVAGGFSIESESFLQHDIVYRVSTTISDDAAGLYLHRMKLDDDRLNTMERDLNMGRRNLVDIDALHSLSLDSKMAAAWFANADIFDAADAVFPNGANIDPSDAMFNYLKVSGDVLGFRNIETNRFEGAGISSNWSSQGNMIADRASIADAVHVGRNLTLRTTSARTVSGFSVISAYSASVPFISADQMHFANGFGITISSELAGGYSSGPLKLGNWSFPSSSNPRFSALVLKKSGGDVLNKTAINETEYNKILGSGWKSLKTKIAGAPIE
ncbi:MAG: hypothetical protein LBK26_01715 [Rickettsiales bacterium]|jgi:hypothetical protein|nr:hypothetical protein [Rickettsiales bacterium]